MLQHLVDESPDRSDGAAVAAATACYLVDMRAADEQREELQFFTNQLLGQVARRHSQVEEQEIFDFWVQQLELNDPENFSPVSLKYSIFLFKMSGGSVGMRYGK